jgi:toxin CcdB
MAQYDVHAGSDGYLYVDIQSDALSLLNTRVVVPLMRPEDAPAPGRQLNPIIPVNGETYLLVTQYMGAAPLASLGPVVGSLRHMDHRISLALDLILHGV